MATLMDRLVERGRIFIRLYKREKLIKGTKKDAADELRQSMLDAGLLKVDCGRSGTVVIAGSPKKEITKGMLVEEFGEAGAKFWDGVEAKTCRYLTVVS